MTIFRGRPKTLFGRTVERASIRLLARLLAAVCAACVIGASSAAAQSAGNAEKGRAAFVKQCALCHTVGKDEPNLFGPNLHGIVGRKAGTAPGYRYSPAFQATVSWDWSPDVLGAWITQPRAMIPGSFMALFFQGASDRDRDDILAYLATQK